VPIDRHDERGLVHHRVRVLAVIGTRPEVIKIFSPVQAMLQRPEDFEVYLASSGQHAELLRAALETFELEVCEDFAAMRPNQRPAEVVWTIGAWAADLIGRLQPEVLLVQGDTATAMAAGLAGYYSSIPVAHVEAGLRTYDNRVPWPEEGTRRMLDAISDLHFAPTALSAANLVREGIPRGSIHVTGNTGIDALYWALSRARRPAMSPLPERRVVVTCHRRESIPHGIEAIARSVRELANRHRDVRFQFVLHPSPAVQRAVMESLAGEVPPNIELLPPCDYVSFVQMLSDAYLIITDSGGVQEEATALGTPLLVANSRTARKEALTVGTAMIVGTHDVDIVAAAERLLVDPILRREMATPSDTYGVGRAGELIAATLAEVYGAAGESQVAHRVPMEPPRGREVAAERDGVVV
jgi:UDP-N-acetylglucosamine 2-epimerase (non-hydrolysing)